jgi:hypothetical protein
LLVSFGHPAWVDAITQAGGKRLSAKTVDDGFNRGGLVSLLFEFQFHPAAL